MEIHELVNGVIERKIGGASERRISGYLRRNGVSDEDVPHVLEVANAIIRKARQQKELERYKPTNPKLEAWLRLTGMQLGCVAVAILSGLVCGAIQSSSQIPINLGKINIPNSIALTILGSLCLSAIATFFAMFKGYADIFDWH